MLARDDKIALRALAKGGWVRLDDFSKVDNVKCFTCANMIKTQCLNF